MNRYDHYPGDYARDTRDLNLTQHGAYRMLLDAYYSTEKPIPDETKFRIVCAFTEAEQKETQWVLDRFFEFRDGCWHHERADREIEKAQPKIRAARDNGKRGGRPRKTQSVSPENPVGFETKTQQEPSGKPTGKPSRNPDGEGEGSASSRGQFRSTAEASLDLPIRERVQRLERDVLWAEVVEPHRWPEVIEVANALAAGFGTEAPTLCRPRVDSDTRRVLELLGANTVEEILRGAKQIPKDEYLAGKGISAVTISVMRRLIAKANAPAEPEVIAWHV